MNCVHDVKNLNQDVNVIDEANEHATGRYDFPRNEHVGVAAKRCIEERPDHKLKQEKVFLVKMNLRIQQVVDALAPFVLFV